MPPELDIRIHLQDNAMFCGHAVAQMVHAFHDHLIQQEDMDAIETGAVAPWQTSPAQLAAMINAGHDGRAPAYVVNPFDDFQTAMDYVVTAVDGLTGQARHPVVVLAFSDVRNSHWILTNGFTAGADSLTVHIRNPLPPNGKSPHAASDRCDFLNRAGAREFVACRFWERNMFVRCPQPPVDGTFVVVGPAMEPRAGSYACTPAGGGATDAHVGLGNLADVARRAIAGSGLIRDGWWSEDAVPPPNVLNRRARLVGQPDVAAPSYYLVPLLGQDGSATGAMGIDAASGQFLWAKEGLPQSYAELLFAPGDNPSLPRLPSTIASSASRLVWSPTKNACASPYFPLVELKTDAGGYYNLWQREIVKLVHPAGGFVDTGSLWPRRDF